MGLCLAFVVDLCYPNIGKDRRVLFVRGRAFLCLNRIMRKDMQVTARPEVDKTSVVVCWVVETQ